MVKYNPKPEEVEKTGWNPKPGNLVPYYLKGINTVDLYNDVRIVSDDLPNDHPDHKSSNAQSFKITGLPP